MTSYLYEDLNLNGCNLTTQGNISATDLIATNDLLLGDGSIINFDSGDITLTHSSNKLTMTGGNLELFSADIILTSGLVGSARTISFLNDDANWVIGHDAQDNFQISGDADIVFNADEVHIERTNLLLTAGLGDSFIRIINDDASLKIGTFDGVSKIESVDLGIDLILEANGGTLGNGGDIGAFGDVDGEFKFWINNERGLGVTDTESIGLYFGFGIALGGNDPGAKITVEKEGVFDDPGLRKASMHFYTMDGGNMDLAMSIDENQDFDFQANDLTTTGEIDTETFKAGGGDFTINADGDITSVGDILAKDTIFSNLQVLGFTGTPTRDLQWFPIDNINSYLEIAGAIRIGLVDFGAAGVTRIEAIDGANDTISINSIGTGNVSINFDSNAPSGLVIWDGGTSNYTTINFSGGVSHIFSSSNIVSFDDNDLNTTGNLTFPIDNKGIQFGDNSNESFLSWSGDSLKVTGNDPQFSVVGNIGIGTENFGGINGIVIDKSSSTGINCGRMTVTQTGIDSFDATGWTVTVTNATETNDFPSAGDTESYAGTFTSIMSFGEGSLATAVNWGLKGVADGGDNIYGTIGISKGNASNGNGQGFGITGLADGNCANSNIGGYFDIGTAIIPTAALGNWALYVNDASKFVGDITIDGITTLGLNTNFTKISSTGDITFNGSAGFYPRLVRQDAEPANGTGGTVIDDEEQIIWIDTNDSNRVYLMYNDNTNANIVKIELT